MSLGSDPSRRLEACNDDLPIAVVLVDEAGKRADVHLDRPRAQRLCRQLEETYGLRKVGSEQLPTSSRSVKRAELERDRQPAPAPAGSPDRYLASSRQQLERVVRAAAASVSAQFVGQLVALGVIVQPRRFVSGSGTSVNNQYQPSWMVSDGAGYACDRHRGVRGLALAAEHDEAGV